MTQSKPRKFLILYLFLTLLLLMGLSACQDAAPVETVEADLPADSAPVEMAEPAPGSDVYTTAQASLPVLTENHQGITYGPDQLVLVFAEGFQSNETLAVSAMHATAGLVKAAETQANERGEAIIYHYTQPSAEYEGAYPQGVITFWVQGSSGTSKSYTFRIDYTLAPQPSQMGCGIYPNSIIHRGGAFIAWCSGYTKDAYQNTEYKAPLSITQGGVVLLSEPITNVMADGLGIVWLNTESSDPIGTWDITIDTQSFQVQVEE